MLVMSDSVRDFIVGKIEIRLEKKWFKIFE